MEVYKMKFKASSVDIILFILTVLAGMRSPQEFVVMFVVSTLWFTIHLVFSKKTLKHLREAIITKYIKGDE